MYLSNTSFSQFSKLDHSPYIIKKTELQCNKLQRRVVIVEEPQK